MKKWMLCLVAFAVIFVFAQSSENLVLKADVNNDGSVDVADVSAVISMMAGAVTYENADVNGDGAVNVADISAIISYMAGQGEAQSGDSTITINYTDSIAQVIVAKNVEDYVTVMVDSGHVTIAQDAELPFEITYVLSGESNDGEFAMSGNYKATVELRGLMLTNPNGAAINITNGKRIALSAKKGTVNTFADGKDGEQKAAIYCKGHLELKGQGTLNVTGNTAHAIKSGDYMSMKNCTVNVLSAVKDGLSANEFFLMQSGTLNIKEVGDDGIQVDLDGEERTGITEDHEDEDSGNIYIEGGTLNITLSSDGGKGMKAVGDVYVSGGTLDITQTGTLVVEESDLSYPTSIKAGGNIDITSGTITINNTADGGKGMSADGTLTIGAEEADSLLQMPTIDITANGKGGVAEITQSTEETEEVKSYKVYVTLPAGGQGGGHKSPVQTPQVWIEDYTLTFDASCVGCMIEIVQDDVVVYTTFVDLNGEVTLPSTLSGTLQLVIYRGDQTFIGEFEL